MTRLPIQINFLKLIISKALVLMTLMPVSSSLAVQDFPTQAIKDAQTYSSAAYAKSQVIFEYDFPHFFGGAKVSRIFEGESAFIQVQYADGSNWKVPANDWRPTANVIALNPDAGIIAIGGYNSVTLLDSRQQQIIQCPDAAQASKYHLVHVGDAIYGGAVISDNASRKDFFKVFKVELIDRACNLKTLGTFPVLENTYRLNLFDQGGKLGLLLPQARWFAMTGTDSVDFITLNLDGAVISKTILSGFKLSDEEPEVYPNPSSANLGVLIPFSSVKDPEQHTDLYLLNESSRPKLISKNALSGFWLDAHRILVNRGTHAASSELVILSGTNFKNETIISSIEGFKRNLFIDQGSFFFTNETRDVKRVNFKSSLTNPSKTEILTLRQAVPTGFAKIPVTKEVSYQSGNHMVASILSIPEGGCAAAHKRPVLVYAHGGNEHTSPIGHRLSNNSGSDSEYLLFTQLGWVVLEMNYYGNNYLGANFSSGMTEYLDRDRRANTMLDYQNAGIFAKALPCADPKHIILVGHSYGSDMGGLYVTQKQFEATMAYSGIVLQGGSLYGYGFEFDMKDENPRLAIAEGEGNKHINPAIKEAGVPIISPAQRIIGVDAALQVLSKANTSGKDYYGVIYQMSEETLNAITPKLRVSQIIHKPILISEGHNDGNLQAGQAYEADLKNYSELIQYWYPTDATENHEDSHVYAGTVQLEYVRRVVEFSK